METQPSRSLGDRVYRQLLKVFGPAQLGRMGTPRVRSENRLDGVQGQWVLRRNTAGRTYLVPADGDHDGGTEPQGPSAVSP